jgi:hypothetical protein
MLKGAVQWDLSKLATSRRYRISVNQAASIPQEPFKNEIRIAQEEVGPSRKHQNTHHDLNGLHL